ncbi:MerR family transcriptional regulator [Clostridium grantii]|uniref:DNA-binding transcriptional regulator, MerR family n=1 Tax=Clostridium grantii DSM 8605 TaxID=1121316 RepID=A0A1M5X703_9CLOT|nr:MerR family transcriptional regulator [Clostridium grantii]SHH95546.1 DNA-binding transcriptional regulator, MerR family [Clostridium grantii DSM 8605]
MNLTVKQVAKLTGITVRTLHYYDEIALLTPATITEAGYRLYNDENLERLQQILFFREIDFELKNIKEILDNPDFDKVKALEKHKKLLELKRNRMEKLITLVDKTLKGEKEMSFKEFDMNEINKVKEKYKEEAKERWGDTEAYKESNRKTSKYGKEDWEEISKDSAIIYKGFADNMDKEVSSPEVQHFVQEWQNHITKYFYNCTKEILAGLGEMYVADERFTKNIDKYGEGLAEFMSKAIYYYCRAHK